MQQAERANLSRRRIKGAAADDDDDDDDDNENVNAELKKV
jgi:hypothetical protein